MDAKTLVALEMLDALDDYLGRIEGDDKGSSHTINAITAEIKRQAAELEALRTEQSDAARDVLTERRRQVEAEGWTPEHDDKHGDNSMAVAAACYALADIAPALTVQTVRVRGLWSWTGWAESWFKPKDKRRNLIRAAALLLAEIERLDRAARAGGGK